MACDGAAGQSAWGERYRPSPEGQLHWSAATPLGGVSQAGFVELPMTPGLAGPPMVIELEDRFGLKLTVRLVQGSHSEALALARELWRQRA